MATSHLGSTIGIVLVAWLALLGIEVVPLQSNYTAETVLVGFLFLILGILAWFWFSVRPRIGRY